MFDNHKQLPIVVHARTTIDHRYPEATDRVSNTFRRITKSLTSHFRDTRPYRECTTDSEYVAKYREIGRLTGRQLLSTVAFELTRESQPYAKKGAGETGSPWNTVGDRSRGTRVGTARRKVYLVNVTVWLA